MPSSESDVLHYSPPPKSGLVARIVGGIKRHRKVWLAVASVLVLHAGIYVVLSLNGRFEPATIGLSWVKWYDWAPAGFVTDYKPNKILFWIFLPEWCFDRRFWHRGDDARSGKFPIHMPADVDEVRRAWK